MAKKKMYFAQNKYLDTRRHRAKYFYTLEEAEAWLEKHGGGTIKKRNAKIICDGFNPPFRVWGEVPHL